MPRHRQVRMPLLGMSMRTGRFGLFCCLTALLAACGGPATGCADIGADPGVQITADAYRSDVTAGHTVEVCADGTCGTTSLDGPFAFVTLDDLREEAETTFVVVVRDQEAQQVQTTTLTTTPVQFKPGGDDCQFSVARLRLSLAPDGTAQTVGQGRA